jgi:cytochrome bd-type quinol oxidase subunit 2
MNVRIKSHVTLALGVTALLTPALMGFAHAQAIDEIAQSATNRINIAWGYLINMIGYVGGVGLLFGSLFFAYKKHNRTGGNDVSYGRIIAAAVVGTCLLAIPFYERTVSSTIFGSRATITGEQQTIRFDQ